ncbi:MAG: cryptochrome/photolyase family protein [Pseudonocardiaceae bacterium]
MSFEPAEVMWFRRDLRTSDNPALLAAASGGGPVLALFVLDPRLFDTAGPPRRAYLLRSLRALDGSLGGALHLRCGDPAQQVVAAAREIGAHQVHVAADYGPYGSRRDAAVEAALGQHGITLVRTGSPYAVAPGRVRKPDGSPYRVFTPFSRAWLAHGWRDPAGTAENIDYVRRSGPAGFPDEPDPAGITLPEVGVAAASRRWQRFLGTGLAHYHEQRDRPDLDGTSRISAALKYGELHPRTLLADLADRRGPGTVSFRTELCWREFYADVLHHHPASAWTSLDPTAGAVPTDTGPDADAAFHAWTQARTGYPIVDAGMRHLHTEGWMPNRLRMITASFLVKDLHLPWQRGAQHFMDYLIDGDLASNNHGWQWVAGTGTDAAPYIRIFNPTLQATKADPAGDYVRHWIPELRSIAGPAVHEPWKQPGGPPHGYPPPLVDHPSERAEALRRYHARGSGQPSLRGKS